MAREFFKDLVVTNTNAIYTDTRAYGSLSAAITAIGSANQHLVITRTETVTGALTIPINIDLTIGPDGYIDLVVGALLTINGGFHCGLHQCFDATDVSALRLRFGRRVPAIYPEWFGANPHFISLDPVYGDHSTEAIQAAIDCVTLSAGTNYPTDSFNVIPIVFSGHYGIDSQITLYGFQHLIGTSRPTFYSPPVIQSTDALGTDPMFLSQGHPVDNASVSLSVSNLGFSGGNATGIFYFPEASGGITQVNASIYFDHCRFGGLGSSGIIMTFESGGDIQISNCVVDVCNGAYAFAFTNCSNIRMLSNEFFEPFGKLFGFFGFCEGSVIGNNITYTNDYFMVIDALDAVATSYQNIVFSGNTVQAGTAGYGGQIPSVGGIYVGAFARTNLTITGNVFDTLENLIYFAAANYSQFDTVITGNTFRNCDKLIDAQALLFQIGGANIKFSNNQSDLTTLVRATIDDHALIYEGYLSPDFNNGVLSEYTAIDILDLVRTSGSTAVVADFTLDLFYVGQFGNNLYLDCDLTLIFDVLTTGPPATLRVGSIKKHLNINSYAGTPPAVNQATIASVLPSPITSVTYSTVSVGGNAYVLRASAVINPALFPGTVTYKATLDGITEKVTYPLTIKSV
jgi:hypothetical protein